MTLLAVEALHELCKKCTMYTRGVVVSSSACCMSCWRLNQVLDTDIHNAQTKSSMSPCPISAEESETLVLPLATSISGWLGSAMCFYHKFGKFTGIPVSPRPDPPPKNQLKVLSGKTASPFHVFPTTKAAEVPLTSLVAETVLRNLPQIPEGLEVVKLPMKMSEVAQLLGICVRPDAEMCWLILRSLCHLDESRGAKKHRLYTVYNKIDIRNLC